jgi:hypothetical protein
MKFKTILSVFSLSLFLLFFVSLNLSAQGHFEFGFHYGSWNIDLLETLIEEGISKGLEEGLKESILDAIRDAGRDIEEISYAQSVRFDSWGNNWGFELRWYPGGHGRSFSLGLSVEQTTMRVSVPDLAASLTVLDVASGKQGTFQGDASGSQFEIKPLSFHLHFRWDIAPRWKVRPFITFGLGMAGGKYIDEGRLTASFSGELQIEGQETETYEETVDKTLKELEEEMEGEDEEFFMPPFLPFIQLNLGIKGEITPNLYLLVEAGVFDGFIFRGGISIRL